MHETKVNHSYQHRTKNRVRNFSTKSFTRYTQAADLRFSADIVTDVAKRNYFFMHYNQNLVHSELSGFLFFY